MLFSLTSAVVCQSVPVVSRLTLSTRRAFGVVEALETLASSVVTWLWVQAVNIAVALTSQALTTGLFGVAIVTRSTLVTAGPWNSCMSKKVTATWNALKLGFTTVALSAVTDYLVRGVVSLTRVCIEVTRAWVTRAGTRPTMVTWPEHWISKESFHTTEN